VVLREEIRKKLGPTTPPWSLTTVAAIKRLRQTLGDSADNPCFIETLARRGYRWIARMEIGAQPPSLSCP
jgi:DNA-binding winged helix-turn-helix (wHTH) protein